MLLKIITPTSTLYEDNIKLVQLPGTKGKFEILENHAPIISSLENGLIKVIDSDSKQHHFIITGGIVECKKNTVIILAESGKEKAE